MSKTLCLTCIVCFTQELHGYSSLLLYKTLKCDTSQAGYLLSQKCNFKSLQLKFKSRTGILGIGADLFRQHRSNGICGHCNTFESTKHFIFKCPLYNTARATMFDEIRMCVDDNVFNNFLQCWNYGILKLLGDHDNEFNGPFCKFLHSAWSIHSSI